MILNNIVNNSDTYLSFAGSVEKIAYQETLQFQQLRVDELHKLFNLRVANQKLFQRQDEVKLSDKDYKKFQEHYSERVDQLQSEIFDLQLSLKERQGDFENIVLPGRVFSTSENREFLTGQQLTLGKLKEMKRHFSSGLVVGILENDIDDLISAFAESIEAKLQILQEHREESEIEDAVIV